MSIIVLKIIIIQCHIDFYRVLNVYYKPSYFKYSLRAYSTPELLLNPQVADDVLVLNRGRKRTSQEKGNKKALQSKSKSKSPKSEKSQSLTKTRKGSKDNSKSEKNKTVKNKEKLNVLTEWPKNIYNPELFYLCILY